MIFNNEALTELVQKAVTDTIEPLIKKAVAEAIEPILKNINIGDRWLSPKSAEEYADTTRQSLERYVINGVLKGHRLNGNPRFRKSDIDAAMELINVNLKKHK